MIHPYHHNHYAEQFWKLEKNTAVIEYSLSGLIIVVVDYVTFYIFFNTFHAGLLVATIMAYMLGFVASYLLNRFWVFRKAAAKQDMSKSMIRYSILIAFNLVLTYGMLWAMERGGLTPLIGKFVVNIFMYFWIYIVSKYWVFKEN